MRAVTGNLVILAFIVIFSILVFGATKEFSEARPLGDVLEENIDLKTVQLEQNSYILDRHGEIVSEIYGPVNRINLTYDEIPENVKGAFLSAEDQSFYEHKGFDLAGIARAFIVNYQNESTSQGGSTITQQLVRNVYLSGEKTYERKLTELLYAYQLEQKLSKEKIIELYVNAVYFHNGIYGIEAASNYYFSKSAEELSLAETAFLSSVPNSPERYNPLKYSERTHERKEWILQKMLETDWITREEFDNALDEEIVLSLQEKTDSYPDYVTYIHHELEQLISEKEGYSAQLRNAGSSEERQETEQRLKERTKTILNQGVIIETALNPELQEQAAKIVRLNTGGSLQAAAVIIDHTENETAAITGGTDYQKFNFHRGFQAYRQPGSSLKPLLVFAPFIEETGLKSKDIIDASPFSKNGYNPKNSGGGVYGRVAMETAFMNSYNTAAVRMMDTISPETAFSYMRGFDFTHLNNHEPVLPAALGGLGNGVSVLEMTQAYTAFANDGKYKAPRGIRKVTDLHGNTLYEWSSRNKEVWSPETAGEINKMMNKTITSGTGRQAAFSAQGFIGGKTGTTNDYYDLWFIGSSNKYTSGVWVGYDTPAPVPAGSRQSHLHIWKQIMMEAQKIKQ